MNFRNKIIVFVSKPTPKTMSMSTLTHHNHNDNTDSSTVIDTPRFATVFVNDVAHPYARKLVPWMCIPCVNLFNTAQHVSGFAQEVCMFLFVPYISLAADLHTSHLIAWFWRSWATQESSLLRGYSTKLVLAIEYLCWASPDGEASGLCNMGVVKRKRMVRRRVRIVMRMRRERMWR